MTDRRQPMGWTDWAGVASVVSLVAGVWILAGVGWALVTLGGLVGAVVWTIEVAIPLRTRARRER